MRLRPADIQLHASANITLLFPSASPLLSYSLHESSKCEMRRRRTHLEILKLLRPFAIGAYIFEMRSRRAQKRSGRTRPGMPSTSGHCRRIPRVAEKFGHALLALSLDNYAVPMPNAANSRKIYIPFQIHAIAWITSSCLHRSRTRARVVMKFRASSRRVRERMPSGSSGLAIVTPAIETARALFTRHHCWSLMKSNSLAKSPINSSRHRKKEERTFLWRQVPYLRSQGSTSMKGIMAW